MNTIEVKKNEEISSIISKTFDSRMEFSILSYIMEKGSENIAEITDEEINEIEGDALATPKFYQALVSTARELCKKFSTTEIMTYIRCEANFSPFPKSLTFYREESDEDNWEYLCSRLNVDYEKDTIKILVITK